MNDFALRLVVDWLQKLREEMSGSLEDQIAAAANGMKSCDTPLCQAHAFSYVGTDITRVVEGFKTHGVRVLALTETSLLYVPRSRSWCAPSNERLVPS